MYLDQHHFVSFTDPSKQLRNVEFAFKFLNCRPSVQEIYRFINFLEVEILFFILFYSYLVINDDLQKLVQN